MVREEGGLTLVLLGGEEVWFMKKRGLAVVHFHSIEERMAGVLVRCCGGRGLLLVLCLHIMTLEVWL